MPIPALNDFLLPFLTILSDGQTYTRSQMLGRLAQHFGISDTEVQQMSGSQFTLVSRVAWCDVHFVKAGFVSKTQDARDSLQDMFRITSLGVRELGKRPERLTVGYLQSFYRGKVRRGAGSDDTTSEAELQLYERFEKLPDAYTVFHSVKWFAKSKGTVGEVDFIIAHPSRGLLVLEVKGGVVQVNNGQWSSTAIYGRINPIKDPCEQAERNRRALREWLADDSRTRRFNYAIFPAVALPDSRISASVRPDCPQDIFIDMTHLDDLEARLIAIYDYWKPRADGANQRMDGAAAVAALNDLLVPTVKLQPRIADIFERERRKIDELTKTQYRILRQLRLHKRAAIIGGAGTGKTMLAMEKAVQLAEGGYRVLLLCYTRELANWIGRELKHPNIVVATLHSFLAQALRWARLRDASTNMNWEEFHARTSDLLMDAANVIRAPGSGAQDKLFDAIIVDEAQDFEDTWWIPLPDFLKDPQNGVFYVFFDDNQRIFTQISSIPMETEPLYLDENCRNTQAIHASLFPYARSNFETISEGPEGRPVEIIAASDKPAERRELQRVLHRLVNEEGIAPKDIVILTASSDKRSQWKENDMLGNFVVTWDLETEMPMAARVSNIYRYKGLECAVVILTELEQRYEEISDQLIYVGLSRARHHAIVLGRLPSSTQENNQQAIT